MFTSDEMLKARPEFTLLWEIIWEVTEDIHGLWEISNLVSNLLALWSWEGFLIWWLLPDLSGI